MVAHVFARWESRKADLQAVGSREGSNEALRTLVVEPTPPDGRWQASWIVENYSAG
jgi:hypothetical protein